MIAKYYGTRQSHGQRICCALDAGRNRILSLCKHLVTSRNHSYEYRLITIMEVSSNPRQGHGSPSCMLLIFTACQPDSWNSPRDKRIIATEGNYDSKRASSGCVIHSNGDVVGIKFNSAISGQGTSLWGSSPFGPESAPGILQWSNCIQS